VLLFAGFINCGKAVSIFFADDRVRASVTAHKNEDKVAKKVRGLFERF